ncbi:unnamed protein product [Urochloa decumbens]|uniref:Disease resistance N-terminal domain-containing protein n=1 Tax=Urochloa decumbens TaxID=240449 RepID=A0ABC8WV62_9POAL
MEAAISAVATEIFSRMISFLMKRYKDKTETDQKLDRMQQLLLRIHAVVEEAEGRYITNPIMLRQLKRLVESMYQGYHILDIFRYKPFLGSIANEQVKSLTTQWASFSPIPFKRSRTSRSFPECNDLQSVLENLEAAIANMNEFVVLLGGCDRCRRPYDTYLYTDNFMFGRHVEKQRIINILLQGPEEHSAPMVLPIIGGFRVGKKTLVSHVCKNERIIAHFSSIMFINGDSIWRMDEEKLRNGRMLVVVEFVTEVDDDDWLKFYSTIRHAAIDGSKVIIISRIENLARFGTVKTVFLNSFTHEEYKYLFKLLAFGSIDEKDNPHLAAVASELAVLLRGSLITANVIADLLRRNQDLKFWIRMLQRFKGMVVDNNLSMYGEHPKDMLDSERPIDITPFTSSCPCTLRLMPPRVERDGDRSDRKLDYVYFGDLISGSIAIPKNQFVLVAWESRLAPYTKIVADVAYQEKQESSISPRKRRSMET